MAATTSAAVAAFKELDGSATKKLENTSKRDYLISLEKKYQKEWEQARLFEVNAPSSEDASIKDLSGEELRKKYPKFFGTFPYPYMNGSLHLGHGFTISKIEFATGFERMLGKRALFPVGFHCTGMPIKASSDKLIREMEMFGRDFENYSDDKPVANGDAKEVTAPTATQPATSKDAQGATTSLTTSNVDKSKKSKVNAKSTGLTYQFQIMESIGVPREEIKNFSDPKHWIDYFPPICREDLTALGARVDWRRSFVTTDVNPYYDSFVRWQINKLREMEYIKYGKRHTIYSPKDGQPCMDHDRASGEAVGPQEYTGLKMEVSEWSPALKDLPQKLGGGKRVFMIAATLRTETVYGQTACYVGPNIKYGLYEAKGENEIYLVTERAARNMAFQDLLKTRGEFPKVAEVKGSEIVGTRVRPPMSIHPEVYILPMETVLATKGTGVVTSCPSDSPDDYTTYMELRKKPEYYKVDPKWLELEPTPMLETPNYGTLTAIEICKKLKISSPKDTKQLAEAKEIAYREGFYQGTMIVGEFKGMPVQEAKPKVREILLRDGLGVDYQEPESLVMSRSADECVVALVDQWYMDYGQPEWKAKAEKLLAQMNTYQDVTRHAFEGVLGWLRQWACARSYGLGTKVPFDQTQLVESLSDSTIYMSYYTIAHLLHSDVQGQTAGPLGIQASDLTDATWDYIFGRAGFPKDAKITQEQGEALRREYNYFYPMDIRSSGKDLIPNHLTFCIYVHAALFPEEMWPRSMRANGHLLLNSEKMSKSTGNFLTLRASVEKYGADATRLCLADAGDAIEDANFDEEFANATILRLHTRIEWCNEIVADQASLRTGDKNFWDRAFEAEVNSFIVQTKANYADARYKDALKTGFFELQQARDAYQLATAGSEGMHRDLVFMFMRIQALLVLPVAPHFSEHIWKEILKEKTSIHNALFPEPSAPVDQSIIDSVNSIRTLITSIRSAEASFAKKKAKGKATAGFDPSKPKAVRIFTTREFPGWQTTCIESMKESWVDKQKGLDMAKLKASLASRGLMKEKRAMPFCVAFAKRASVYGNDIFDRKLLYDEQTLFESVIPFLKRQVGVQELTVETSESGFAKAKELGDAAVAQGYDAALIEQAEPGDPKIIFFNI